MGNAHKLSNESGSSDEWQSIQLNVTVSCMFWNICLWKLWILFNVLNVLSQLHEDMLPINVTIAYWFHFYCCVPLHYPILYDDETLINIYNKVGFLFYFIVECCKMLCCWTIHMWMIYIVTNNRGVIRWIMH